MDKKPYDNKIVKRSNNSTSVITIDEDGLNDVLQGKDPQPYVKKIKDFTFRY